MFDTFLLGGFLLAAPFYVFRSGVPQPGDIFFTVGAFVFFLRNMRMTIPSNSFFRFLFFFCAIVSIVNLVSAFFLQRTEFLIPPFYYLFNTAVAVFIFQFYRKHGTLLFQTMFWGIFLSVFLQFALILVGNGFRGYRNVGFFNNPNQLGYFSLSSLAIMVVLIPVMKAKRFSFFLFIFFDLLLVFLSLSKAAIISFGVVLIPFFWYLFSRNRFSLKKLGRILLFFPILLLCLFLAMDFLSEVWSTAVLNVVLRFSTMNMESDGSFFGRGYARIWINPERVFLGVGEGLKPGEDPRFDDPYFSDEIHSSLGTILFSYGILGFLTYLLLAFSATGFRNPYLLFPMIGMHMYSLTHQGLRFTLFWVFLVMAWIVKEVEEEKHVRSSFRPFPKV